LLEHYSIRPGEIRVKIEIADWLLYSLEELSRLLGFMNLIKEIKKLRLRVRYGVKEELLPLIKLEGVGRARARKLYNNKIRSIGDLRRSDLTKLSQILGKSIALNVRKQLGFKDKEISEKKRKGQLSIKRFNK